MPLTELPPNASRFLSISEDIVYTVIPDGHGTYIVVSNDAYGDVKIESQGATKDSLLLDYNIFIK